MEAWVEAAFIVRDLTAAHAANVGEGEGRREGEPVVIGQGEDLDRAENACQDRERDWEPQSSGGLAKVATYAPEHARELRGIEGGIVKG